MPHADAANIDLNRSKKEIYETIYMNIDSLLDGQDNWVTNLSNAASILFWTLKDICKINWAGFYLFNKELNLLTLGPFHGLPACQTIKPEVNKGICADSFCSRQTILVQNVDEYPGTHIACDSASKSELVVPLLTSDGNCIGVMDFDSLVIGGFDEVDEKNMNKLSNLITNSCKWN